MRNSLTYVINSVFLQRSLHYIFQVPSKPKTALHRGIDGQCRNKKNNVNMCKHEAWISIADVGHASGRKGCSDADKVITSALHLDPIVILCDSSGVRALIMGVSPAIYLNPFLFDNESYKEDAKLLSIVGSVEDIQCAYDCDNKHEKDNNNKLLSIATTLTRDS